MLLPYVNKFPSVLIFADERLFLDLNLCSAITMKVKFIFYDVLNSFI